MLRSGIRRSPWIAAGVLAPIGIQLLYTYVPAMNDLFGSAPLGPGGLAARRRSRRVPVAAYGSVELAKLPHQIGS